MRRIIPSLQFLIFYFLHILVLVNFVPSQNILPASMGAAAYTAMTFCLILAAKYRFLESVLGGPGRVYRAHRVLAHWSWILTLGHWALATPRGSGLIPGLEDFGAELGVSATLFMLLLIMLSVLRHIPYHIWRMSHFLMPVVYVMIAGHIFLSAIPIAQLGLVWWLLAGMTGLGLGALFEAVRKKLKRPALLRVHNLTQRADALDITLVSDQPAGIQKFFPGQHATICCSRRDIREPHPYTIASGPGEETLRFVIFRRGDHTTQLWSKLKVGDEVQLRSISGEFAPKVGKDRENAQIWLAGGAGVTPFLSALAALVPDDGPRIDFIYIFRSLGKAIDIPQIVEASEKYPQLVAHFICGEDGAYFGPETFQSILSSKWSEAELFACGPDSLLNVACSAYRAGGGKHAINAEYFDIRPAISLPRQLLGLRPSRKVVSRPNQQAAPCSGIRSFGEAQGGEAIQPALLTDHFKALRHKLLLRQRNRY